MAETWDMPLAQINKLSDLSRKPVVNQFGKLASVLMIDKLAFWGLGIFVALFSLLVFSGALALLGVVFGIVAGGGLSLWSSRGREVDATATMELNSERILDIVGAKFVTFGHTHEWRDGASRAFTPGWRAGTLEAAPHLIHAGSRETGLIQPLSE